jgi:lysozyme family protein
MATFDEAFVIVVGVEGGLVDNPADPGGLTKFGVSSRSYPNEDIRNLTLERAKALYLQDYWLKVGADKLPPPLALLAFDSAVNNGPGRASRFLQQAAGVAQDGIIGPATLAAVAKKPLAEIIAEFQARRTLFMLTLPTVSTFGLGWSRRLFHVTLAALAFEAKAQPVIPDPPPVVVIHDQTDAIARIEAIEVTLRKLLEDKAYTDALNQRPHVEPVP